MSDLVTRLREAAKDMQRGVYNPSQIAAMKMAADALDGLTEKLAARTCPHYVPNRHDRGVDDCCTDFLCEVKYLRRWIPAEERLPEEPYGCLLVVWDSPPMGGDDSLNYLPYFAGWDGERWNDGDGNQVPFEVAYWMKLPEFPEDES